MREEFDGVLKELRWRGPPLPLIEPTKLFEYNIRLIGAALSRSSHPFPHVAHVRG